MASCNPPEPIVNSRERKRFSELKHEYEDFRSPGFVGRQANRVKSGAASAGRKLQKWVPGLGAAQKNMKRMLKEASDKQIVKQALSKAAKGGDWHFDGARRGRSRSQPFAGVSKATG